MKRSLALAVLLAALVLGHAAKGGHEIPVYPSYYPHQIDIRTVDPARALDRLSGAEIHAYVGQAPRVSGALPDTVGAVESLGSMVLVTLNPNSPLTRDEAAGCGVAARAMRLIARPRSGVVFHPYPVTPFDGDYLHHADRAEAAKTRWLARADAAATGPAPRLKLAPGSRLGDILADVDHGAEGEEWDVRIDAVDAADLVNAAMVAVNGWIGPPWVRSGWYRAYRLLAGALHDADARNRAASMVQRLENADFDGLVERINLERDLVVLLDGGCGTSVAGYTLTRHYYNAEYSAGIENIGYDAVTGFASPMFLRTAKLKDFPWNGWLVIGTDGEPRAAWNPVAGFTDRFGRLVWSALSDPAVLPAPNDAGWTLNRISDVRSVPSP